LAGGLTVAASVRDASSYTITGGVNNDSIAMENAADVLDGGTQAVGGADTLVIDYAAIQAGITVDLTAADQISSMDGSSNTAIQKGFEDLDLSAFLGFGAVVTGTAAGSTMTGSPAADRITGGKSADTITGGTGADQLNGGGGNDTFFFNTSAELIPAGGGVDVAVDTIEGGSGTDKIVVNGAVGIGAAGNDSLAKVTNVGIFQLDANAAAGDDANHSLVINADARLGSIREFDFSTNLDADADAVLTFTSVTVALTIKGGTGEETIIGSSAADTITGGPGVDIITGGAGNDIVNGGTGADVIVVAAQSAGGVDSITGLAINSDKIKHGLTENIAAYTDDTASDYSAQANLQAAALASAGAVETALNGSWATIGDVATFTYDSKTYAVISTANATSYSTADILVELVGGVTGFDIDEFIT